MLGEGVDLFSVPLPASLENKLLSESRIGSLTGLSVVAIQQNGETVTKLRSEMKLEPGAQLVMLGDTEQRTLFSEAFGGQFSSSPW